MAGTERGLVARATRLMRRSLVFDNMLDATAYIVVCVGAAVALLQASPASTAGIALVIGGTLAWLLLFRAFSSRTLTIGQATLAHLTMIALTFLVLSATWLGAGLDWLLALATVALLPFRVPLVRAILFALLVWAGTVTTLALFELPARPDLLIFNVSTLTPAFLFCFLFPLAVRREGMERARAEALVTELEAAQRQLRAYAAESEELAISRERNRMAREIHDTLGHYLTILAVQLETALKMEELGDARLHAELVEARRAAAECLTEVRRSVAALRPADLTALSLPDALARLVSEYEALDPTIEIALDVEGSTDPLDLEQRLALYRCAQEALTNIRKHASASRALLRLRVDDRKAEFLALDDGRGATAGAEHAPGFGLLGIRERVALLGGTSSMGPEPGKGWRVQVTLPIQQNALDPEDEATSDDAGIMERGHATSAIR
jgi:signal transduction histidine kinase